jgi:hypothetical protein
MSKNRAATQLKWPPVTTVDLISADLLQLTSTYFNAVETVENVVFKFVPSACTVAMIATAMPAAMRQLLHLLPSREQLLSPARNGAIVPFRQGKPDGRIFVTYR